MPVPCVLVTRPASGARHWVGALGAQGIAAQALSLIEIVREPMAGALAQARRDLGQYAAAMFVSGNAVRAFLQEDAVGCGDAPLALAATRAWSPGPGTTQALLVAGWSAARIDAPADDAVQFDSESLWARVAPQVRAGVHVLIVRGGDAAGRVAGRNWLAAQLAAAGARVEQVVAYRRIAARLDDAARSLATRSTSDGSLWLFSSAEALANLRAALPHADWRNARALATHPRIAQAALDAGFGTVRLARPQLADVVASIKSWE